MIRRSLQALVFGVVMVLAAGPAYAVPNELFFEGNVVGEGTGGNLSDDQIQDLIDSNSTNLGVDVFLAGKIEGLDSLTPTFEAEDGFEGTFLSFDCSPAGSDTDCQTGFTVAFNFGGDFQIVKVAVKGGQDADGIFAVLANELQVAPLAALQEGVVSDDERALSCGTACSGASNILVFVAGPGEEPRVPEPATLLLLGLGLTGLGFAGRLRNRS